MVATSILCVAAVACGEPGDGPPPDPERLSRTEFTEAVENFFEYEPLRAGRESEFLIHLTELAEGAPVADAEVDVRILSGERILAESRARPGAVSGIYVAALTTPAVAERSCDVEFRIRSASVDETMRLSGFFIE
jgi:hypothetical protein